MLQSLLMFTFSQANARQPVCSSGLFIYHRHSRRPHESLMHYTYHQLTDGRASWMRIIYLADNDRYLSAAASVLRHRSFSFCQTVFNCDTYQPALRRWRQSNVCHVIVETPGIWFSYALWKLLVNSNSYTNSLGHTNLKRYKSSRHHIEN